MCQQCREMGHVRRGLKDAPGIQFVCACVQEVERVYRFTVLSLKERAQIYI